MPLEFYTSRADSSGAGLFISFNSKEGTAVFDLISQTGFDNAKKQGVFKGGKKTRLIFNKDEIGGLISAINKQSSFRFYHSFQDQVSKGEFKFYQKDDKCGFGLVVDKDETKYKVGFSLGAAEALKEYLKFALFHIFYGIYAADKKEAESRKKPVSAPPKPEEPAKPEKPEEPEEPEEDKDLF